MPHAIVTAGQRSRLTGTVYALLIFTAVLPAVAFAPGGATTAMAQPSTAFQSQTGSQPLTGSQGQALIPFLAQPNGQPGTISPRSGTEQSETKPPQLLQRLQKGLLDHLLDPSSARVTSIPLPRVGRISHAEGAARIERGGPSEQAAPGLEVRRGDRFETAADARVSIQFDDGTRVALGERTSMTVLQIVVREGRRTGAVLLRLAKGAMRLSAAAAPRQHDKRVEVRTVAAKVEGSAYDAVLALRDQALTVVLLEGRVEVRNMAGSVEVDKPRRGIEGISASQPPGRAYGWDRERVRLMLDRIDRQ